MKCSSNDKCRLKEIHFLLEILFLPFSQSFKVIWRHAKDFLKILISQIGLRDM